MAITKVKSASAANAVYGLGFLGALVYYLSTAPGVLEALVGIFKAIFWPAFMVFELMHFLGM